LKEEDFFGRERELPDVYSRLLGGQSVSLIGERRIGKSSLLYALNFPSERFSFGIPENLRFVYADGQLMARIDPNPHQIDQRPTDSAEEAQYEKDHSAVFAPRYSTRFTPHDSPTRTRYWRRSHGAVALHRRCRDSSVGDARGRHARTTDEGAMGGYHAEWLRYHECEVER
jgi:hypothetical protein